MNRITVILCVLLLFGRPVHAQDQYTGQTIADILALPEDDIDLGIACLVLAKDAYPDLKIEVFDALLDSMAIQLHRLMQGVTDPEARIAMMNTYLYRPGWWDDSLTFTYDLDDLEAAKKENQFLNGYLATRKGSCMTMPMLHLVLADRVGWPMSAVRSPKHFFVRYVARGFPKNNIEATAGGGYLSDQRYIADLGIPTSAIRNGVYLRTLSKKEYIASLLLNNARHFQEREQNLGKAIHSLNVALSIDSMFPSAHWNLGQYYLILTQQLEQEMYAHLDAARAMYDADVQALRRARVPELVPPTPVLSLREPFGRPNTTGSASDLFSPLLEVPALGPHSLPAPANPAHSAGSGDLRLVTRQQEFQAEQAQIQHTYVPHIQEALARSMWHKQKAKDLGIVLQLPQTFFIRQAKSIEVFRRTGKY